MHRDRTVSDILKIYDDAVCAAHAGAAVRDVLKADGRALLLDCGSGIERFEFERGRLIVIGAGKAAAPMASAAEEIFGSMIAEGIICVKDGHTQELSFVRQLEASHPVPDARGERAAREMFSLASSAGRDDLVLAFISGGASALLPLPAGGITLEEKRRVTDLLLACGAPIHDINCVRKHLSAIKGGQLARAAFPARIAVVCVSDVVGDDLSVIGSGPFYPDSSTFSDALAVLSRCGIVSKVPSPVLDRLQRGAEGLVDETPKQDDPCFRNAVHHICMSSGRMTARAAQTARSLGYDVRVLPYPVAGDTAEAAADHVEMIRGLIPSRDVSRPLCLLSGGETTVQVKGRGKGGRNTEFVLRASLLAEDIPDLFIAAIGTDGSDGPTDAAGAWMSTRLFRSLRDRGIDAERYAEDNDSYSFMDRAETLVKTGPTWTNVLDLRMMILP